MKNIVLMKFLIGKKFNDCICLFFYTHSFLNGGLLVTAGFKYFPTLTLHDLILLLYLHAIQQYIFSIYLRVIAAQQPYATSTKNNC